MARFRNHLFLGIISCFSLISSEALAAYTATNSNGLLTVTGFVTNSGVPVASDTATATVTISANDGTNNCNVYSENLSGIVITNGDFSLVLGSSGTGTLPGGYTKLSQVLDATATAIAASGCSSGAPPINGTIAHWQVNISNMVGAGTYITAGTPLVVPLSSVPQAQVASSSNALQNFPVNMITTAPANGNIMMFNASGQWVPSSPAGAGLLTSITAGTGISVAGSTVSLATPVGVANGGTGINGSAAANGSLLIGNGAGFINTTLTAGAGISIANGAGTITISNTGANPVGSALTSGNIWVGSAGNVAAQVPVSGDVSLSSAGATLVNKINGTAVAGVGLSAATDLPPLAAAIPAHDAVVTNPAGTGLVGIAPGGNTNFMRSNGTDFVASPLAVADITALGFSTGSGNLGASTAATSPQISGDATSGLYTAGAGKVDVSITGSKIVEFSALGEAITATSASPNSALAVTQSGTGYSATFSGGNVGVGTTSPISPLSVGGVPGASATAPMVLLGSTALVGGAGAGTYIGANSASGTADFINYEVSGTSKFKVSGSGAVTATSFSGNGAGLTGITASPGGADKAVQYAAAGVTAGDATNFVWDYTNKRLGIGTATPIYSLEVDTASLTNHAIYGTSNSGAQYTAGVAGNNTSFGAGVYGNSANGNGVIANSNGSNASMYTIAFGSGAGISAQSSSGNSGIFQSGGAGNTSPTLVTEQFGGSTADLFQAQNSGGSSLFKIDYTGRAVASGLNVLRNYADAYTGTSATFQQAGVNATATNSAPLFQNTAGVDNSLAVQNFQVTNSSGNPQVGFVGTASISGVGQFTPAMVFGLSTGPNSYAEKMRLDQNGNLKVSGGIYSNGVSLSPIIAGSTVNLYTNQASGSDNPAVCNGQFNAGTASTPNCAFATVQGALAALPASINGTVNINVTGNQTTSTPIVINQEIGSQGQINISSFGGFYNLTNTNQYIFGVFVAPGSGLYYSAGTNPIPNVNFQNLTIASPAGGQAAFLNISGVVTLNTVNLIGGLQTMGGFTSYINSAGTSTISALAGNNCSALNVSGGQVQLSPSGSGSIQIVSVSNGTNNCSAAQINSGGSLSIQGPNTVSFMGSGNSQQAININDGGVLQSRGPVQIVMTGDGPGSTGLFVSYGGFAQIQNTLTVTMPSGSSNISAVNMYGGYLDVSNSGSLLSINVNGNSGGSPPVSLSNSATFSVDQGASLSLAGVSSSTTAPCGMFVGAGSTFGLSGTASISGNPAILVADNSTVAVYPNGGPGGLTVNGVGSGSVPSLIAVVNNSVFKFIGPTSGSSNFSTSSSPNASATIVVSRNSTVDFEPSSLSTLTLNQVNSFIYGTDRSVIYLKSNGGAGPFFANASFIDRSSTYDAIGYSNAPQTVGYSANCNLTGFNSAAGVCYMGFGPTSWTSAVTFCGNYNSHLCTTEEQVRICSAVAFSASAAWSVNLVTPSSGYTVTCATAGAPSIGSATPLSTSLSAFCCQN